MVNMFGRHSALVAVAAVCLLAVTVHSEGLSVREQELRQLYAGYIDELELEEVGARHEGTVKLDKLKGIEPEVKQKILDANPRLAPQPTGEEGVDESGHYGSMDQGRGGPSDDVIGVILASVAAYFRDAEGSWEESLEYCENMSEAEADGAHGSADECKALCHGHNAVCTAWHYTAGRCFTGDPARCASDMGAVRNLLRGVAPTGMWAVSTAYCFMAGCPDYQGAESYNVAPEAGQRSGAGRRFVQWASQWVIAARDQEGARITVPAVNLDQFEGATEEVLMDKFEFITSAISGVMQLASDREVFSPAMGSRVQSAFQKVANVRNPAFKDLVHSAKQVESVKLALETDFDGAGNKIKPVLIDERTQRPLALQARTTLFDEGDETRPKGAMKDEYLRHLSEVPPHYMEGFLFRSARVTLGDGKDVAPTIEVDSTEVDRRLINMRASTNAFGTDKVQVYEHFDGEFARATWEKAAHLFRGLGYDTDETYDLGVVYRSSKPPSKLEYTSEEYGKLAGTVWHKDVYATANVIFYPFCFLEGYDTEIVTREVYEEVDPKSENLGAIPVEYVQFDDQVTLKSFGNPEEGVPPTGAVIAFQNDYTRHVAHPPKRISEEARARSIEWSKQYNGGERLPNGIVRVFLHFTLRARSKLLPVSSMELVGKSPAVEKAVSIFGPGVAYYYKHIATAKQEIASYQVGGFAEKKESQTHKWAEEHRDELQKRAAEHNGRVSAKVGPTATKMFAPRSSGSVSEADAIKEAEHDAVAISKEAVRND